MFNVTTKTMITTKLKKSIAAALAAATLFTAPAAVADAHYLSSAQEKQAGNEAVAQFQQQYRTYRHPILDHIQDRLMVNNKDRLWYYGQKPGEKRGLEHALMADVDSINAYSYPGGQVFVHAKMLDFLSYKSDDGTLSGPQNPWSTDQIYQMSSLAATMGHEFAHWSNEDWLRTMDKQITTRFVASLIPVGNLWAMLGVAAGANLVNALNSRQMGFRTEQQADEWGMKFCENVPEYSIGGEAIYQYRALLRKQAIGTEEHVDWLHPHSKTAVRLERALKYQEESSNGFIQWKKTPNGYELWVGGKARDYLYGRDDVTRADRTFYVMGQLATAIKLGIAADYNLILYRGDECYERGNPNETYVVFRGTGKDGRTRIKLLDKYTIPKDKIETIMSRTDGKPYDVFQSECRRLGVSENEMLNYTYPLVMLKALQENRIKYSKPVQVMEEYGSEDN